jgi:hypothetical protein
MSQLQQKPWWGGGREAGWRSGKQKQAGINQRFLKQYSLDKKGLFAP